MRPWKVLTRRVLLSRPPWMEVGVERVELPDGRTVEEFLWVKTRDFAMAVAVTPDGQVVLERSYKHGVRRVALSLPAGYVEAGEAPDQAARRELREETGYTSDEWRPLGSFTVDGNYGVCIEHIFLARNARRSSNAGGAVHDDLEEIEVLTLPLEDAMAAVTRARSPGSRAQPASRSQPPRCANDHRAGRLSVEQCVEVGAEAPGFDRRSADETGVPGPLAFVVFTD